MGQPVKCPHLEMLKLSILPTTDRKGLWDPMRILRKARVPSDRKAPVQKESRP